MLLIFSFYWIFQSVPFLHSCRTTIMWCYVWLKISLSANVLVSWKLWYGSLPYPRDGRYCITDQTCCRTTVLTCHLSWLKGGYVSMSVCLILVTHTCWERCLAVLDLTWATERWYLWKVGLAFPVISVQVPRKCPFMFFLWKSEQWCEK